MPASAVHNAVLQGQDITVKIRRWRIFVIMKQRGITFPDLARELSLSKQRVHQMFLTLTTASENRIDQALTSITKDRIAGLHLKGPDRDDPITAVIWDAARHPVVNGQRVNDPPIPREGKKIPA